MSVSADQVIGDRLETLQDVIVYEGFPGSDRTRVWKQGKLTPKVETWIKNGELVFWSFNEEPPILYAVHSSQNFKRVPDSAPTVSQEKPGLFSNLVPSLGATDATGIFGQIRIILVVASILAGIVALIQFIKLFRL